MHSFTFEGTRDHSFKYDMSFSASENGNAWSKDIFFLKNIYVCIMIKGVPSAESSCSVWGLGKGVSGKPYPRLCNARRPRLEPGTFRSQAVRLYRLHQARPSNMCRK